MIYPGKILKYLGTLKRPDVRSLLSRVMKEYMSGSAAMTRSPVAERSTPPPAIATIAITPHCPLDCWHCSVRNRSDSALGRSHVIESIKWLVEKGTSSIALTGGEPFLSRDLTAYLDMLTPPVEAQIYSSGYGLDDELAETLSRYPNLQVLISIDHSDPSKHDQLRGHRGAYARAHESLNLLRRAGLRVNVSTLVTHERIVSGELDRFLRTLHDEGIEHVQVFEPRPVGALKEHAGELLSEEDILKLRELAHKAVMDSRYPLVIVFYPLVEHGSALGCCSGVFRIYIDPAGNVCPCDFNPVSFGRIQDEPLDVIWERMHSICVHPRYECFTARNCNAIAESGIDGAIPYERLSPFHDWLSEEPAGIWRRHGSAVYGWLVRRLHITSILLALQKPHCRRDLLSSNRGSNRGKAGT